MSEGKMTLMTVGGGALAELFESELQAVLKNIRDPNSDVKKSSKITIEVTLKPMENRASASMTYIVKSQKAPTRVRESNVMFGVADGLFICKEIGNQIPGQIGMNVTPITKEG